MIERIDTKIQLTLSSKDSCQLYNQFEQMFIAADHETEGYYYSGDNIEKSFPKVYELFKVICLSDNLK